MCGSAEQALTIYKGKLLEGEPLLRSFAASPDGTLSREALAGEPGEVGERTIDVQINRLRRKIEDDPGNPLFLQTVRGVGYRLRFE